MTDDRKYPGPVSNPSGDPRIYQQQIFQEQYNRWRDGLDERKEQDDD